MRGCISAQFPPGEAAVRAIEAGADLLLVPPKPEEAVNAVVVAVRSGRIPARRIDESALRILEAKARVGLDRRRLVDLEQIGDAIDSPEEMERAQAHADAALTLVKNDGALVPLANPNGVCFVVLAESRYGIEGLRFIEKLEQHQPKAAVTLLDPALPEAELDAVPERVLQCEAVVVAAFAGVSAYRGNVALPGGFPKLVDSLVASGRPVALVAFGNPYLLRRFPNVAAYLATFSTLPTSEVSAVNALFGEVAIRGKLPVTIPGLARIGDGLQMKPR